jgi:hypothetical protein
MKIKSILCSLVFFSMATTISHAQDKTPVLRHVVMFKFKDTSTKDDVKKIEEAFKALPSKIKLIKGFEWGTNSSPEGLNQGLTHCFFVSFGSDKDRDDYIVNPDHKVFVALVGPHVDRVTVLDYWAH